MLFIAHDCLSTHTINITFALFTPPTASTTVKKQAFKSIMGKSCFPQCFPPYNKQMQNGFNPDPAVCDNTFIFQRMYSKINLNI